jgi:hypothetical protein
MSKDKYTFKVEPHHEGEPFLSIITRCMEGKRPKGITANKQSIDSQLHKNFEQVFINDPVGYGMLEANKSFSYVTDIAKGQYIHLLDDDDIYTNDLFTKRMENVARLHNNPEIILFKMKIWTGDGDNIYPKPDCWGDIPKIARIGGSCFIVRKDVYDKHIHQFGIRRCGDFNFLKSVWTDNPKAIWHDEMMCESKPSHGKAEAK